MATAATGPTIGLVPLDVKGNGPPGLDATGTVSAALLRSGSVGSVVAVEAGKPLAGRVDFLVQGKLGHLGSVWLCTLTAVDPRQARTVASCSERGDGDSPVTLLEKCAAQVASALPDATAAAPAAAPKAPAAAAPRNPGSGSTLGVVWLHKGPGEKSYRVAPKDSVVLAQVRAVLEERGYHVEPGILPDLPGLVSPAGQVDLDLVRSRAESRGIPYVVVGTSRWADSQDATLKPLTAYGVEVQARVVSGAHRVRGTPRQASCSVPCINDGLTPRTCQALLRQKALLPALEAALADAEPTRTPR